MLPLFLHFQYDTEIVCDNCNRSGKGMIVLMKYTFCKECAKKIIPVYQKQLSAISEELEK